MFTELQKCFSGQFVQEVACLLQWLQNSSVLLNKAPRLATRSRVPRCLLNSKDADLV